MLRVNVAALVAVALAASGCGVLSKGKHSNTPVLGNRIAVLTGEGDVTADPATAALPMTYNVLPMTLTAVAGSVELKALEVALVRLPLVAARV